MATSRRAVVLGTAALAVAAFVQVAPTGGASAPPTATQFTGVAVVGVTPPAGAPNNPAAVVVQGQPFSVALSFDAPLSYNRDSTVSLTVPATATAVIGGTRSVVVPAGATTATASGVTLAPAANRLQIIATVTAGAKSALAVPPGQSVQFDVVTSSHSVDGTAKFANTSGDTTPCVPTADVPQCADLLLPFATGTGALLSVGRCDTFLGCDPTNDSVVQALALLGPSYTPTTPATLVLKCDKTACPGGGVSSYVPLVNLSATGSLSAAAACTSKGVVNAGSDYCVDYVQSKRNGAGDLLLYLLFWRDVRGSCC